MSDNELPTARFVDPPPVARVVALTMTEEDARWLRGHLHSVPGERAGRIWGALRNLLPASQDKDPAR